MMIHFTRLHLSANSLKKPVDSLRTAGPVSDNAEIHKKNSYRETLLTSVEDYTNTIIL